MSKKTIPALSPSSAKVLLGFLNNVYGPDQSAVGHKCWTRKEKGKRRIAGEVTAVSMCRLHGCGGTRLHVRWPDGKRTRPCLKGCDVLPNGDFQIR